MTGIGILVVFACWVGLWATGEVVARLLFGRKKALVALEIRPVLGLATITLLLELTAYFLPIRIAAWFVIPPAILGLFWLVRAGGPVRERRWDVLLVSLVALGLGLVPVVVAGRFTAAAITNNDATYYITAADRFLEMPWATFRGEPSECLREKMVSAWFWRTGTSNLVACITALTGVPSPFAMAVVTTLIVACVPAPALMLARQLGVPEQSPRFVLVGGVAAFSAAALFLAYQHLAGHLAAYFLFPLACAATLAAVRRGGVRRILHAGILLGASVAWFADAGSVLGLAFVVGIATRGRYALRAGYNGLLVAGAAIGFAPFTMYRAMSAVQVMYVVRLPSARPIFPQRGWLDRGPWDDLATVMGVDPWPPWPSPWPPTPEAVVMVIAAVCGAGLALMTVRRLRRHDGLFVWAITLTLAALLSAVLIDKRYLLGKVMLTAAAFATPACAAAVAFVRGWTGWLIAGPFVFGELVAADALMRPERWHVIDRPEHDAFAPMLARLPAGSLIALDGFGAPADAVLDAHRAHRAALLARLVPIQPGLDGGFYRPVCKDPPPLSALPPKGYALQRLSSERVSVGRPLETFGDFRLLEVDFARPDAVLGAWAPTQGWLSAERELDGRVFRWAESAAQARLRAVLSAPCMSLRGELRTTGPQATARLLSRDRQLFEGSITGEWSDFRTRPLEASHEWLIQFAVVGRASPAAAADHQLALRGLSVEPAWSCLTLVGGSAKEYALPADLDDAKSWQVLPALGLNCAELVITIAGDAGGMLGVAFDEAAVVWHYLDAASARVVTEPHSFQRSFAVRLSRRDVAAPPWRVLDIVARPRACGDAR